MTGPSASLAQLYDEHADAIFGFALALTRGESATEDIVQEIFCRLARNPACLSGVQNVRSYLLRMAHRLVIDAARRDQIRFRHRASAESAELFETANDPDESARRAALAAALEALPADQRAVVHLKLWEGLTFEAIGAALGISQHTAASRYRYGVEKLRTALRPLYEEIQ